MAATPPSTSERSSAAPAPEPHHPTRRRAIGIGIGAVAAAGLASWVGFRVLDDDPTAPQPPTSSPSTTEAPFVRREWLSGASGDGVADGSYAAARRSDVEISATWFDDNTAMLELYTLQPGEEFADWQKPLDVAIGGIDGGEDGDETWAEAAAGAYDDRWRESLTRLREVWGDRPATMYLRFAHEMNGDWYPWAVTADEADDFRTAWRRYRALQQEVFPAAQLTLCFNRESVGTGMDWRELYPGEGQVDLMSVDYYNQNPAIDTDEGWERSMSDTDRWGGPQGLQGHLDFAESVGLPLAVSEWSGNAEQGDHPLFVRRMNDFFARNGGTGAGELLYEVQFNVGSHGDGQFLLVGEGTRMPESQAEYLSLQW